MFGWAEPRCPVDPEQRAWIDARWAWLREQFGAERPRRVKVVLPTREDFPDPWDGTPEAGLALLARVQGYMGLAEQPLRTGWFEHDQDPWRGSALTGALEQHGAAGLFFEADLPVVMLEAGLLSDTTALVATIAHELAHVHLIAHGRLSSEEPDHEPLTDLLTVFLGLGVFTANATIQERNWQVGNAGWWQVGRQGYLDHEDWGYALALLARERGEGAQAPWARHLRPDVHAPFIEALRFLERDARHGAAPESARAPSSGSACLRLVQGLAVLLLALYAVIRSGAFEPDIPLHVLNATPAAAEVRLGRPDREATLERTVPTGQGLILVPGEGRWWVEVEHAWGRERVEADLRDGARDAAQQPVYILNVAGAAAVLRESIEYVPFGQAPTARPPQHRAELWSGATLGTFEGVHFVFAEFPEQAKMRWGDTALRTRLWGLHGPPLLALSALPGDLPPEQVLSWLEHRLRLEPRDEQLRAGYQQVALMLGHEARAQAFLSGRPAPSQATER